jgi:hypothetical protein
MLINALIQDNCLSPIGTILPDKKIPSIKLLREHVISIRGFCGLAQAKNAIEDWQKFLPYVRKNGYPPMDSNDTDYQWRPVQDRPLLTT